MEGAELDLRIADEILALLAIAIYIVRALLNRPRT